MVTSYHKYRNERYIKRQRELRNNLHIGVCLLEASYLRPRAPSTLAAELDLTM